MKKLTLAILMGVAALSGSAQVNYKIQTACNPIDVKHYDTERLRSAFVMAPVMVHDEIYLSLSLCDRFIFGGAVAGTQGLVLENL
jgi:5-keto 4-deoxyuronate isomerase